MIGVGDVVPPGLVPPRSLVRDADGHHAVVLEDWAEWVCLDGETWWAARQERWNPAQLGALVTIVALGLTGDETGPDLAMLAQAVPPPDNADPPGLYDADGWFLAMAADTEATAEMKHPDPEVRERAVSAAARVWYDRRHALSAKLAAIKVFAWPLCLMFSNEQVADLERRLHDLHELWRAVESRHPDGKPDENPFHGIADRMVAKAKLKHEMRVLDPCVGDGEIVRAAARIAAVKFDALALDEGVEARMLALRPSVVAAGGTLMARQQDILSIHPEPIYDAVFMNMGGLYTAFSAKVMVQYAWGFVKSGGVMVAFMGREVVEPGEAGDMLVELIKAGDVEAIEDRVILTVRKA